MNNKIIVVELTTSSFNYSESQVLGIYLDEEKCLKDIKEFIDKYVGTIYYHKNSKWTLCDIDDYLVMWDFSDDSLPDDEFKRRTVVSAYYREIDIMDFGE